MEIVALLQAAKRDVSPHISLPTYVIGLGSGGTIVYQIAISGTQPGFQAHTRVYGPHPSTLPSARSEHRGHTSADLWRTPGRGSLPAQSAAWPLGARQYPGTPSCRVPIRRLAFHGVQRLQPHTVPMGSWPYGPAGCHRQGPGARSVAPAAERP